VVLRPLPRKLLQLLKKPLLPKRKMMAGARVVAAGKLLSISTATKKAHPIHIGWAFFVASKTA
jgi:hypothetical protein